MNKLTILLFSLVLFVCCLVSSAASQPQPIQSAAPSVLDPQAEVLKLQAQEFEEQTNKAMSEALEMKRKMRDLAPGELISAVLQNNLAHVEMLIKQGADLNVLDKRYNFTPLGAAASKGFTDVISALLKGKADINLGDGFGYTPLMTAVLYNQVASVKLLVQLGADLKKTNNIRQTASAVAKMKNLPELVKYLEEAERGLGSPTHYVQP